MGHFARKRLPAALETKNVQRKKQIISQKVQQVVLLMFGTSALQAKLVKPMKLVKPSLIETVGCWQQSLLIGHIFAAVNDNLPILRCLNLSSCHAV